MCGIVGYLDHGANQCLGTDYLQRACQAIFHRGPDDEGWCKLEGGIVGLGMRRLSIIDLVSGHQPMYSDDQQLTLVFNGEIYNYIELRKILESKGCIFQTTSDTEVLLQAYRTFGIECLSYLNGMFAFAIWDASQQQLFIARDRFGEKPLYYYFDNQTFLFGSEIKSILEADFVPRVLDFRGLDHFLSWLAVPDPDTMFKGIHKLPPAHYLLVKHDGTRTVQRYWQLSYPEQPRAIHIEDAKELLLDHIRQSIRIRLRADVPLGILLSGGVDSSSLVALASQEPIEQLRTFSVGFDIPGYDEFEYSRQVAQLYNTNHTEVTMKAMDYWQMTQETIRHLDEPMADTAAVALMHICKVASQSVKVVLSGEGADELLAGYQGRYVNGIRQLEGLPRLGEYLPAQAHRFLRRRFSNGGEHKMWWRFLQPLEYQFLKESIYGYYEGLREPLYADGPLAGYEPDENDLLHQIANGGHTLLQRMSYVDTVLNLPAYLLQKSDKMSMAASIELRAPYLDYELAEFCTTLPDHFKLDLRQDQAKILLKKALEGMLPHDLLYRPKQGFPVPINDWVKEHLREPVSDTLFCSQARIKKILNTRHIENMWNAHQDGSLIFGLQLWQLTLLELWMREFNVTI